MLGASSQGKQIASGRPRLSLLQPNTATSQEPTPFRKPAENGVGAGETGHLGPLHLHRVKIQSLPSLTPSHAGFFITETLETRF